MGAQQKRRKKFDGRNPSKKKKKEVGPNGSARALFLSGGRARGRAAFLFVSRRSVLGVEWPIVMGVYAGALFSRQTAQRRRPQARQPTGRYAFLFFSEKRVARRRQTGKARPQKDGRHWRPVACNFFVLFIFFLSLLLKFYVRKRKPKGDADATPDNQKKTTGPRTWQSLGADRLPTCSSDCPSNCGQ
ncbi:hypothetical protein TW95_gp0023 [Pandoravirus inopinatum]|uniref:Transmembrane protein n=1 Tax=Pandoravirus inopinatum TaxID=1605721 RepID=A0A0B5JB39_9VIRU|nr:hypothetical protein TW95_gp0023 [Pandoravirus inopinatum]AJF96757.1 hypothetical protein [Pandoravirus inopinatum]